MKFKPLNINDLRVGMKCFTVQVWRSGELALREPFVVVEPRKMYSDGGLYIVSHPQPPGFQNSAESLGLLVGTKFRTRFPDTWHRTFEYSDTAYEYFQDIVSRQDVGAYEKAVGKRIFPTAEQQIVTLEVDLLYTKFSLFARKLLAK